MAIYLAWQNSPKGTIVVVRAGTPGTANLRRRDGLRGFVELPPSNDYVLVIYAPTSCCGTCRGGGGCDEACAVFGCLGRVVGHADGIVWWIQLAIIKSRIFSCKPCNSQASSNCSSVYNHGKFVVCVSMT
jgi:hypothetical protein